MARTDPGHRTPASHRRTERTLAAAARNDLAVRRSVRDPGDRRAESQDRAIYRALGLLDETGGR